MPTVKREITTRITVVDDEIRRKVLEVLDRTPYYAGPETAAFEAELAAYCGAARGVATNSGTSALLVSLIARGIGRGDEVLVPANTFVSVPECVLFMGATPVFTDVEADGNMSRATIEPRLTRRTRGIIPVHTFGIPVDMDPIMELAHERNLFIVEDGAHALGARYRGRRVGSIGHVGFFSFGGKSITVCGQAGMAVTNDADLATRMASARVHGYSSGLGKGGQNSDGGEDTAESRGLNLRTTELHSAIGRLNLKKLDAWTEKRKTNAMFYNTRFAAARLPITLPIPRPEQEAGWLHYTLRGPKRDALKDYLREQGVHTSILYRPPLYRHTAFTAYAGDTASYPMTEALILDILSLPSHPWMSGDDLEYVADHVVQFYRRYA
jgi:dTDP-4-amino-4,6-dideoxygalactose transaminase